MNTAQTENPPPPIKKILGLSAVAFSLFLHAFLFLLVGGAVIVQAIVPKQSFTDFLPEENSFISPEISPEDESPTDVPLAPSEELATDPPASNSTSLSQPVISLSESLSTTTLTPAPSVSSASSPLLDLNPNGKEAISDNKTKGVTHNMASFFGNKGADTKGLVGYLYDLKQDANKKPTDMVGPKDEAVVQNNVENLTYRKTLAEFLRNWNTKVLEKYYKAPESLSTFQFFIPRIPATAAPSAFEVEKEVKPKRWVVHYSGSISSPVATTLRFVGVGDDILVVRLDRKIVLDGSLVKISDWNNDRKQLVGSISQNNKTPLYAGDWIKLEAGKTYPMEVLIGEQPGGAFFSFLLVQEKEKNYTPRPGGNGLVLPIFQTSPTEIPKQKAEIDSPTAMNAFSFGMDP